MIDPFHVVRLAGDALDRSRRRVQQTIHRHRGRGADPLYRMLHAGAKPLTDKQIDQLTALFADDRHVEVEATWGKYQRMIAAYRKPERATAKEKLQQLISSLTVGVPKALTEVVTLGKTLKKRASDVLATSTGPAPATNPPRPSTARAPARLCPGLQEPDQPHRQIASRDCGLQTAIAPSTVIGDQAYGGAGDGQGAWAIIGPSRGYSN